MKRFIQVQSLLTPWRNPFLIDHVSRGQQLANCVLVRIIDPYNEISNLEPAFSQTGCYPQLYDPVCPAIDSDRRYVSQGYLHVGEYNEFISPTIHCATVLPEITEYQFKYSLRKCKDKYFHDLLPTVQRLFELFFMSYLEFASVIYSIRDSKSIFKRSRYLN